MPTLKELQDIVQSATSAKLNAQSSYNSAQSTMINYYNGYMVNCKYKWSVPALGQVWSQEGCDGGVNGNQHPGCGSQSTCKSRVSEYNGLVGNNNSALSNLNTAAANLSTAQTALTNYVATNPDSVNQQNQIDKDAQNRKTRNIAIIIVIIAASLTGAYFFLKSKGYTK